MSSSVSLLLLGWVVGSMMVAANPSPYFGALGLVFMAGVGGSLVLLHGASYLCFILFLVYLGGMLVVFGYTSAMAADSYPETFGSPRVFKGLIAYFLGFVVIGMLWGDWLAEPGDFAFKLDELFMSSGDVDGVAWVYSTGGWALLMCSWGLLIVLFVVMALVRGKSQGALRAV